MDEIDRQNAAPAGPHIPDRVPWGWQDTLKGLLVAVSPEVALALVALGVAGQPRSNKASIGLAVGTIISALVLDGWYVGWGYRFSLRKHRRPLSDWGFRPPTWAILWLVPLSLLIVDAVINVNDHFIHGPQQAFVSAFPHTAAGAVLFFLLACVIAPLFEESFFRGFLFQGLASSCGLLWGAVLSSAVFAAVHQQVSVLIPFFALGLLLCWVFTKTRSIWTNIALHSTFNLIAVVTWVVQHH